MPEKKTNRNSSFQDTMHMIGHGGDEATGCESKVIPSQRGMSHDTEFYSTPKLTPILIWRHLK
jgi:hypothetical protein